MSKRIMSFILMLAMTISALSAPAQAAETTATTKVIQMTGGSEHSLALKADGTVWSWGSNNKGQLGDGTQTNRVTPGPVLGLDHVKAVAANWDCSFALKSDGTVWAWGRNYSGRLGDGTEVDRNLPIQVIGLTKVVAIAVGVYHNLALRSDGTVWAWGGNNKGQLGDGTNENRFTPIQVPSLSDIVAITSGNSYNLVLKADGTVWAWGDNSSGLLGDGTETSRFTPTQTLGLSNIIAISTGDYHSLALKSDGTVWVWGDNGFGELGDGTDEDIRTVPAPVFGFTDVIAIVAGGRHSLVLRSDGTVWAWGYNDFGQCGNGNRYYYSGPPTRVLDISDVVSLAAGGYHSLALEADGTAWVWGDNNYGQVGDGDGETPYRLRAVRIVFPQESKTVEQTAYISMNVMNRKEYTLPLRCLDLAQIISKDITFEYDPQKLGIVDFAVQVPEDMTTIGSITGTMLTIISAEPGKITFRIDGDLPTVQAWNGLLTVVRLFGVNDGDTEIVVTVFDS